MSKNYRLMVDKIPLENRIPIYPCNFKDFDELYLEFIENPDKLKPNVTKPIFVRNKSNDNNYHKHDSDNEFFEQELDELEKYYDSDSDNDRDDHDDDRDDRYDRKSNNFDPTKTPNNIAPDEYNIPENNEPELDPEEVYKQQHAEYLFKFMVLRKKYPNAEIPEFTDHSDLDSMKRVYEQIIRRVNLDSSVEYYKKFLVGGIVVMELVCTNWLGIDLSGFSQNQKRAMNDYDQLLIELGEKHYSVGSKFPVEVRLCGLILFNAVLFYVQKQMFSGGGGGGIFGQFMGGNNENENTSHKTKMRGPTISPSDIEQTMNDYSESDS